MARSNRFFAATSRSVEGGRVSPFISGDGSFRRVDYRNSYPDIGLDDASLETLYVKTQFPMALAKGGFGDVHLSG